MLIVYVRPFSVSIGFAYLFTFRIALLPSAGKELTSWLSAYAVLLYAVLTVCVPFPFDVWLVVFVFYDPSTIFR